MLYKDDWDKSKERLKALWENEVIDRCCVALTAPRNSNIPYDTIVSNIFSMEQSSSKSHDDIVKFYTDPERVLDRYQSYFEKTYFGGEAFPGIWPNFGTAGHAAYFDNCKYEFARDTIWFHPVINDWSKDKLEFDPESDMLVAEKKLIKYLAKEGKGKFFVGMPDNCGSLDALAHLRGNDALLIDMVDNPDMVKSGVESMVNALKTTGDEFFNIIKENNENGSAHALMQTWSEGKHMQIQCDMSVMISPESFEEFVLPELEETTTWLDHAIYHLDGQEQIRHLDMILSVKKINMIQWTPVTGQPCTSDFIPCLKKIQKAGKGLFLSPNVWEIEQLLSELSPKGLYFSLCFGQIGSIDEANELIKKISKWSCSF